MSRSTRPRFAVVREDSHLEASLIRLLPRGTPTEALVVASGGCTALDLVSLFPGLGVTAFDLNPVQLAHTAHKGAAARSGDGLALNVGGGAPFSLNQDGDFEGLFRLLRDAIVEFVAPAPDLARFFDPGADVTWRRGALEEWRASRYWPAAFAIAFTDELLHAMFGPEATQHAPRGSYPAYFQAALERGLAREDAAKNRFLQHILLGHYLPADAPRYLQSPAPRLPDLILGTLLDVPDVERFDLFSLSNIFDWSDDRLVETWAQLLCKRARPGSFLLLRQLNNRRDLGRFFGAGFTFDEPLGARLLAEDQSLFYERILVGRRSP